MIGIGLQNVDLKIWNEDFATGAPENPKESNLNSSTCLDHLVVEYFFFTDYFLAIICVHILHKGLSCHGHFHIDQPTGFLDSRLGECFLAASMVKAWRRQGEIYRNIIKTFIFLRQQKTVVNFNLHHLRARNLRCLRMPCSNISSLHHYVRCRLHDQEPSGHRCLLLLFCLLPIHRRPSLHAFLPPTQEQRRTHHSHALKLKLK